MTNNQTITLPWRLERDRNWFSTLQENHRTPWREDLGGIQARHWQYFYVYHPRALSINKEKITGERAKKHGLF